MCRSRHSSARVCSEQAGRRQLVRGVGKKIPIQDMLHRLDVCTDSEWPQDHDRFVTRLCIFKRRKENFDPYLSECNFMNKIDLTTLRCQHHTHTHTHTVEKKSEDRMTVEKRKEKSTSGKRERERWEAKGREKEGGRTEEVQWSPWSLHMRHRCSTPVGRGPEGVNFQRKGIRPEATTSVPPHMPL